MGYSFKLLSGSILEKVKPLLDLFGLNQKQKIQLVIILSLIVALGLRLYYHLYWAGPDFWGDSYHHWLISQLTLTNQWVYTDYKGLETIWLPSYHYLISLAMFILDRSDLFPAHVTNMMLGTLACGLLAWLMCEVSKNWLVGLGAGLTLAMLPWHIAYSHMNMPEVLAGVLLLALLLTIQKDQLTLLPVIALVSTLTRHELTLFLGGMGIWLVWHKKWGAVWRLGFGIGLGLAGWAIWSWYRTGHILGWWSRYVKAIAWDAQFETGAGIRLVNIETLLRTINQAYPTLMIVGVALIILMTGITFFRWRYRFTKEGWLLVTVLGIHWLILGRSFIAGYLPGPDPRYILITLPILVGVGTLIVAAIRHRDLRSMSIGAYALLLLTSMVNQLPEFSDRAYILAPEKTAGEYLGQLTSVDNQYNFWVDAPLAIYHSNLEPDRFFSSDLLLPIEARFKDSTLTTALAAIEKHNIRYILWEDVSYTFVGQIWPQMAHQQVFEQDGYRFEPVFHYSGWELDFGARPTIVWEVSRVGGT